MSLPMGIRVVYLRHGQTDLNLEHRMQGSTDAPLNDRGRTQLTRAAARLAGETFDAVYTSDLLRARHSAELALAGNGPEPRVDPRLREQDLGSWEGEIWFDLAELFSKEAFRRFMGDIDYAPGGGETRREVRTRLRAFLTDLVAEHSPGDTVLVVGHGGPLFVLLHDVLDIPYSSEKRFYGSNGGVSEFLYLEDHWQLVSFNETHFQGDATS